MTTTRRSRGLAAAPGRTFGGAVLATVLLAAGTVDAGPRVRGAACKNGKCTGAKDVLFDTGADQSFLSRACATALGLMADADGDGTPDAAAGSQPFNGGDIQTWCFTNVAFGATSSRGQVCTNTTTVYVSKKAGDAADDDILGVPWQNRVDACYRARNEETSWPWEAPAGAAKPLVPKSDTSGEVKPVLETTMVGPGGDASPVDLVPFAGASRSIIPQSVASALGAPPIDTVCLEAVDPDLLESLRTGSMLLGGQTCFDVVMIEIVDLGLGPVLGPVPVLVSDDLNSQFGVLGDDLLPPLPGDPLEYLLRAGTASGELWYGEIDCDGNGLPDVIEIAELPLLDANGNGILDACEEPYGAVCLPDGSCEFAPAGLADFTGGTFLGAGVPCADVICAPPPCDTSFALAIVQGSGFIHGDALGNAGLALGLSGDAQVFAAAAGMPLVDAALLVGDAIEFASGCGPCAEPALAELERTLQKLQQIQPLLADAEMQLAETDQQLQDSGMQLEQSGMRIEEASAQLQENPIDFARVDQKLVEITLLHDRSKTKLDRVGTKLDRVRAKLDEARQILDEARAQLEGAIPLLLKCGDCGLAVEPLIAQAIDLLFSADLPLGEAAGAAGGADQATRASASDVDAIGHAAERARGLIGDCAACPADFDGDGNVGFGDLLVLLASWDTPGGDLDGDGLTAFSDLLILLASWGPCTA